MAKLYASGDGALHFAGCRTLQEAIDYFASSPDTEHLRQGGWHVLMLDGLPVCIAPITRVDARTLRIDSGSTSGTFCLYTYHVAEGGTINGHIIDNALILTCTIHGRLIQVKNESIRATVRHFLKHERAITAHPPVEIPFVAAGEGI